MKVQYQSSCPQPVGVFTKDGQSVPAGCGDWGCGHCGFVKKARLRDVIEFGMTTMWEKGEKTIYFVVTTSLDVTATRFRTYWNRFMTSLRTWFRRQGIRDFRYSWTTEWGHQNNMKHRHGIMNHRIPKHKYSELWEAASDGHCKVTYLRQTRSQKQAGYIVKYLAKDSQQGLFEKGERRYGTSRNWPRAPPEPKDPGWTFTLGSPIATTADRMPGSRIQQLREQWNRLQASKHRDKPVNNTATHAENEVNI